MSESATYTDLLAFSVGSSGRLIMEHYLISMIILCSLCLITFTTCLEIGMSLKMTHRTTSAGWVGVNKTRLLGS